MRVGVAACWLSLATALAAQTITEYPIPTPGAGPFGITAGPDGSLWFTEFNVNSNRIGRVTTAGVITDYSIPSSSGTESAGIVTGSDGNLWFTLADFDLGEAAAIGRITPAGAITEFPLSNPLSGPAGIAAGSDGNLWFTEANINGNKIGRITLAGVITEFPIPTQGYPTGIAAGPDANLWFTHYANKIGRITTGGIITEFSIPTPASQPSGITAGPDGNLWFTEFAVNKIGRITTGGIITEFSIPTPASQPSGITAGPDGTLWFTERAANKIGRITTTGVITEFPIPTLGSDPTGITAGPDGNLWFTELHGNKIGRITTGGVSPTCTPDAHTLCLNQGRFAVTATFQQSPEGPLTLANAVPLTDQSGYFWFFEPANVELIAKVLNGCSSNSAYWVFAAGLTNVGVTLTVTDLNTGDQKPYGSAAGTPFAPIQDTSAFSTCP
jgi:streptogramin lyase